MPSCGLVLLKRDSPPGVSTDHVERKPGGGKTASSGISSGTRTGCGGYDIVSDVERSLIVPIGYEGGGVEGGADWHRTGRCGTGPGMVNPAKHPSALYA